MCVWSVWCQKLMLAHLVAFRSGLWWQTTGDEEESSALQFSKVPMEHLRPVTVCVCARCIFWCCVSPVFLQAGWTDCCGFRFKVYLSLEPERKPMNSTDAVSWPSILVWYMYIPTAPSVYTVWGDKPLSSALCVCDCLLIAVHILCLWTQTEFTRCTYVTAKGFVSREGTQRGRRDGWNVSSVLWVLWQRSCKQDDEYLYLYTEKNIHWIQFARRGYSRFKMNSRV